MAQVWAAVADVMPIQLFILVYLGLATVRFFAVPWWAGVAAAAAFVPASALAAAGIGAVFGPLNGSTGYLPVPILIALYAAALRNRAPAAARGLAIGAGLLAVSLVFRTVDEAVCPAFPRGTHFLWHLINGAMLGWMIRVLVLARPPGAPPAPLGKTAEQRYRGRGGDGGFARFRRTAQRHGRGGRSGCRTP